MASSVDLGNQLKSFVGQLVKTGRYNSRSEILREGVRLIHERETRLAALDASIARGIADADSAGRSTSTPLPPSSTRDMSGRPSGNEGRPERGGVALL